MGNTGKMVIKFVCLFIETDYYVIYSMQYRTKARISNITSKRRMELTWRRCVFKGAYRQAYK